MKLRIYQDYEKMSRAAADIILNQIRVKPNSTFCMPGGSSVMGMYRFLIESYQAGDIDFSQLYAFDMDAYIGLPPFHEKNYPYFNNFHFLNYINVLKEHRYTPNSLAENPDQEASRYAKLIDTFGGLDISASGIGDDGHICFDEPADYLIPTYHVAQLHQQTRIANSRFFNSLQEVPTHSFTLGMKEVMCCKTFLVLASGIHKAPVLQKLFSEEKILTQYPASFLRMHPNCTFLLDQDAASLIPATIVSRYLQNA